MSRLALSVVCHSHSPAVAAYEMSDGCCATVVMRLQSSKWAGISYRTVICRYQINRWRGSWWGWATSSKNARLSSSHKIDTRRTLFIFLFFRVVPGHSGLERADSEVIQRMRWGCMGCSQPLWSPVPDGK